MTTSNGGELTPKFNVGHCSSAASASARLCLSSGLQSPKQVECGRESAGSAKPASRGGLVVDVGIASRSKSKSDDEGLRDIFVIDAPGLPSAAHPGRAGSQPYMYWRC
jgi:hypothetical protein